MQILIKDVGGIWVFVAAAMGAGLVWNLLSRLLLPIIWSRFESAAVFKQSTRLPEGGSPEGGQVEWGKPTGCSSSPEGQIEGKPSVGVTVMSEGGEGLLLRPMVGEAVTTEEALRETHAMLDEVRRP